MKKILSLILAVSMAFSITTVIAEEEEAATTTTYVKYTYDFDEFIPEITYLDDKADQMVDIVDNLPNGTKALKVTGDGNDWCKFQIDLPAEISTKYVLVKMDMINTTSQAARYAYIEDSNGNNLVKLSHDGSEGKLYYSEGDCNMPVVTVNNVKTDAFEILLNTEDQTVYTKDKNGEEKSGSFISASASGVKTLRFQIENVNAQIYYDDIEIMGFDDWSALVPEKVTPANGATDVNGTTSEISIKYPITMYSEATSNMNFTVKKNDTELTAGTDYTVTTSGNNVNIKLTDAAGKNATIEVLLNRETVTKFTTGTKNTIEYKYDFDELIPEITDNDGKATPMISYETNPANGTKALKVTGDGKDWCNFQIDLPAEITTKYVLVKMDMINTTSQAARYAYIEDSNGNTLVKLGNDGSDGKLYYSEGDCNMPVVTVNSVKTDSFEILLNTKDHTVYTKDKNGDEKSGSFISASANGVKTLRFQIENVNADIYYDDIEIMGYDDPADIETVSYTVTGVTCEEQNVTSLAEAAGKTISVAVEKTGEFTLICALYEGGTLVEVVEYSDGKITLEIPSDATTKTYTTKLFAWSSLTDITPIMETKSIFD